MTKNNLKKAQHRKKQNKKQKKPIALIVLIALLGTLFGAYSIYWFKISEIVEREYTLFLENPAETPLSALNASRKFKDAKIYGYPGPITLNAQQETLKFPEATIDIQNIHAWSWPLPSMPVHLDTGEIAITGISLPAPINFETLRGKITPYQTSVRLGALRVKQGEFVAQIDGNINNLQQSASPKLDLTLTLKNHDKFFQTLLSNGVMNTQQFMIASSGANSFKDPDDGLVRIQIQVNDNRQLYIGPFYITTLP